MTLQEQYDDAMFDFSRSDFDGAVAKLKDVLAVHPQNFDAQLALGMAFYRKGDFAAAIAEGHKAEKLRPKEQLVHTNLSLFYMKAGDKVTAEKHGLQAKIESWREDANNPAEKKIEADSELQISKPALQPMKFPSQPWKKENISTINFKMKSSYELAMERLNKTSPATKLTEAQKKQLAELDSKYMAKIAEREIALEIELAKAADDFAKEESLREQLVTERKKLQAELEEKKEKVRAAE